MDFIFYDTETTGIETRFDQILQFAAIRTDYDFNILDRFEIRSFLSPHILANPVAMNVTGISVNQLHDPSFPSHFAMCQQIHKIMSDWSPATIGGYNSLSFDEELLRSAFYQSLLPIYLTNTSGNTRFDILKLARTVHRYKPDAMNWPLNDKGKPSFKLDQLAPANGFNHPNAHDAMADVEATIFIARLIKQRAPEIWNECFVFRSKQAAIGHALNTPVITTTDFNRGNAKSFIVTTLNTHPENSGQLFAFDLSHDPQAALGMADDALSELISSKESPLVIVRVNACPVLLPFEIAGFACKGHELGLNEIRRRAEQIRNDLTITDRLIEAYLDISEPYPESPYVEEQIFGGFYTTADNERIDRFHAAEWSERYAIANSFDDPRLKTLALRLIYGEAKEVLSENLRTEYEKAIAKRLLTTKETGKVPWTTCENAISQAEKILEDDPNNQRILEHLADLRSRQTSMMELLRE